jgi:glycosyltransferase involved in cell wall biosynthesis
MPAYNQAKFLPEAIESILKQDCDDWKLYIINDGSTDDTATIAMDYAIQYPDKIEYHYKENGGTGSALNYGFSKAKGKYHTYVSSDNIYFTMFIRILANILDGKPDVGFVYSDFQFINENGIIGEAILRPPYTKGLLLTGCHIGLCFMWRKQLFDQLGGFDTRFTAQDYDFALKCEERMNLYHIPIILGYYRDHPATVSHVKGYDDTVEVLANARKRREL